MPTDKLQASGRGYPWWAGAAGRGAVDAWISHACGRANASSSAVQAMNRPGCSTRCGRRPCPSGCTSFSFRCPVTTARTSSPGIPPTKRPPCSWARSYNRRTRHACTLCPCRCVRYTTISAATSTWRSYRSPAGGTGGCVLAPMSISPAQRSLAPGSCLRNATRRSPRRPDAR